MKFRHTGSGEEVRENNPSRSDLNVDRECPEEGNLDIATAAISQPT